MTLSPTIKTGSLRGTVNEFDSSDLRPGFVRRYYGVVAVQSAMLKLAQN